jgi:hypothetical protein
MNGLEKNINKFDIDRNCYTHKQSIAALLEFKSGSDIDSKNTNGLKV